MCWSNGLNDGDACSVIGDIKSFSDMIGFLGFGWMNLLKKVCHSWVLPHKSLESVYISWLSLPPLFIASLSFSVFTVSSFPSPPVPQVVTFLNDFSLCHLFLSSDTAHVVTSSYFCIYFCIRNTFSSYCRAVINFIEVLLEKYWLCYYPDKFLFLCSLKKSQWS